jgi:hypothetical protein
MVSATIENELHKHLERLPAAQQQQVLDYARNLAAAKPRGVAGAALLSLARTVSADDLAMMAQAIESGCEAVDANGW